jgi:hypothetical protein
LTPSASGAGNRSESESAAASCRSSCSHRPRAQQDLFGGALRREQNAVEVDHQHGPLLAAAPPAAPGWPIARSAASEPPFGGCPAAQAGGPADVGPRGLGRPRRAPSRPAHGRGLPRRGLFDVIEGLHFLCAESGGTVVVVLHFCPISRCFGVGAGAQPRHVPCGGSGSAKISRPFHLDGVPEWAVQAHRRRLASRAPTVVAGHVCSKQALLPAGTHCLLDSALAADAQSSAPGRRHQSIDLSVSISGRSRHLIGIRASTHQ